jgi:adenylosuccinate lyase
VTIPRYTRLQMASIWSPETRFRIWFEIEAHAADAMAELGLIPKEAAKTIWTKGKAAKFDIARIDAIEREVKHDVVAFLTHLAEIVGPQARFVHQGMTSSDILDTCFNIQLVRAADLLIADIDALLAALEKRAGQYNYTPTIGRSHGIHAEPTTFGLKLLGWLMELRRGRARLDAALASVRVGKLSGAVGAYANTDPRVEESALRALGLDREPVATQVVARDRHAALLAAIAGVGATLERFALEVRHLQRTEVREAFEPFAKGQKGSSAMPHKRNPIVAERICGLARILRANALVGLENVALWHERDISHSSAERVVLPDSTIALDYMLDKARWLIEGLEVDAGRMLRNLEASHGLVFSGRVLLRLVEAGLSREDAYAVVQRNALRAWDEERPLRLLLEADPEAAALTASALDEIFDLDSFLVHVDEIFDRTLTTAEVAHV